MATPIINSTSAAIADGTSTIATFSFTVAIRAGALAIVATAVDHGTFTVM